MSKDKKSKKKQDLRKRAIEEAIDDKRAQVIIDDRPCSVEVNRTAKGDYTFSLKVYVRDQQEMLGVIPDLNKIRKEIEKKFKS